MTNKRKRILYVVFAVLLAVIALFFLNTFIHICVRDAGASPFSTVSRMKVSGAIVLWIFILGAGVPSGLMLRKIFKPFIELEPDDDGADGYDDEPGDYDDEDDDDPTE